MSDMSTGFSSNRAAWRFMYLASAVLIGASGKKAFHEERLKFWTDKKNEVIDKIKSEGIDFDDTLSNMLSNKYRSTSVSIRDDLQEDLTECNAAISTHRDRIAGYDAWIQVLETQGDMELDLTQDDWLYFFGKPV